MCPVCPLTISRLSVQNYPIICLKEKFIIFKRVVRFISHVQINIFTLTDQNGMNFGHVRIYLNFQVFKMLEINV